MSALRSSNLSFAIVFLLWSRALLTLDSAPYALEVLVSEFVYVNIYEIEAVVKYGRNKKMNMQRVRLWRLVRVRARWYSSKQ